MTADAPRRARRIALTGGIATGKSHVRAEFERLGVPTIDADVLSRAAVEPGTLGFDAIVARFGKTALDASGAIDRRALGSIVFRDPAARRDLEAIVHPLVRRATDEWFAALDARGDALGMADIPLLFEVGRDRDFDVVVVVACDPETQLRRVMTRDRLTEPEARLRLAAQWPIAEKVRRARHVIWTDGSVAETARQAREVHAELTADR